MPKSDFGIHPRCRNFFSASTLDAEISSRHPPSMPKSDFGVQWGCGAGDVRQHAGREHGEVDQGREAEDADHDLCEIILILLVPLIILIIVIIIILSL